MWGATIDMNDKSEYDGVQVVAQYITHCCLVGFDTVLKTVVVVVVLRYLGVIDV